MTIATLPQPRSITSGYPFLDRVLRYFTTAYWIVVQIPIHGAKVYPPVVLLATSAAFASAQFAQHAGVFPFPFNYLQAISFEWVYIGTLAMSGVKRGKWFYVVLSAGAITSITYIMLYGAIKYHFLAQTLQLIPSDWHALLLFLVTIVLIAAHGLPLTIVNLVYTFLIHAHLSEQNARIFCPYNCGYCSTSEPAVRGHKAYCPNKPKI